MDIRLEIPADYRETETLTREAFWNQYVPGCAEHLVLHQLRRHPDFVPALDFVAEEDGRLVGHIAYTRAVICREGRDSLAVLCLGPVSVLPERQRAGVGSALIRHSLEAARTRAITTASASAVRRSTISAPKTAFTPRRCMRWS